MNAIRLEEADPRWQLLDRCTVQVMSRGTGFFIAPTLIITCTHFLAESPLDPGKRVSCCLGTKTFKAEVIRSFSREELDLTLLKVDFAQPDFAVLATEAEQLLDSQSQFLGIGHPKGSRDKVLLEYEGVSEQYSFSTYKMKGGQIQPGFSGGPLLNLNNGRIIGVIKATRDEYQALGGRAIPASYIRQYFKNELAVYDFDFSARFGEERRKWDNTLTKVRPSSSMTDISMGQEYKLPVRKEHFTGRKTLLEVIEEGFEQESQGPIYQALTNFGGVGKTTLAVEYAYRNEKRYDLIAFLDAATPMVLDTSLLGLAEYLVLPGENAEQKRIQLNHWLSEHSKWLLIADNVDTPDKPEEPDPLKAVQAFIPKRASGHVLITTRMSNPVGIPKANIRSVGVFTREEARDFLRDRTDGDANDDVWREDADKLAEKLGDLPLALEQAAAMIDQSGLSLAEYLDLYDRKWLDLVENDERYAQLTQLEKRVAVTWNINLEKVVKEEPILKDLLNRSAFMSPETIPFEWITQGLAVTEPDMFGDYTAPGAVKLMLTPLHQYSLVQMDGEKGYRLHRLVQEVIRHPLPEEEQASCHLRCMRAGTWSEGLQKGLSEGKDVKDIFALEFGGLKNGAKNGMALSAVQCFEAAVDFPVNDKAA